jgi:hypothetical protein
LISLTLRLDKVRWRPSIVPASDQGEPGMNAFYEHHKESIRFGYRCFDRILLNGLGRGFTDVA